MRIDRFEDIETCQPARELTRRVYALTKKRALAQDGEVKGQIQQAAGSAMHSIAAGFHAEGNRYAKRSGREVPSELYVALDQGYITQAEFAEAYDHAARTRAASRGFTQYLLGYERRTSTKRFRPSKPLNSEPLNLEP